MKLYHYSQKKYDDLRTLEKQRPISAHEKHKALNEAVGSNKPGFYYEHISFFFDPIPYDILGKIYGKEHSIWHPGNQIFEYTTTVDALGRFKYEIVEFPEKIKIFYDESLSLSQYKKQLRELIAEHQYIGEGKQDFIKASRPLVGTTRSSFLKVKSYPNWEQIRNKYAACVPHVMTYPEKGIVKYQSVREVTIK